MDPKIRKEQKCVERGKETNNVVRDVMEVECDDRGRS